MGGQSTALKDRVYKEIKQMIINNELKPNSPLDEISLCTMLNVSRTPIREALNRLDRENFITLIPKKGARVCELSIQSITQLFKVREAVEPQLIQLACSNIETDNETLLAFKNRLIKAIEEKNYNELHNIDYEFHTFLYKRSGNPHLIRIMEYITDQFQRIRTQSIQVEERSLVGASEHLEMIDLLLNGHKDAIAEQIQKHIRTNKEFFIQHMFDI